MRGLRYTLQKLEEMGADAEDLRSAFNALADEEYTAEELNAWLDSLDQGPDCE